MPGSSAGGIGAEQLPLVAGNPCVHFQAGWLSRKVCLQCCVCVCACVCSCRYACLGLPSPFLEVMEAGTSRVSSWPCVAVAEKACGGVPIRRLGSRCRTPACGPGAAAGCCRLDLRDLELARRQLWCSFLDVPVQQGMRWWAIELEAWQGRLTLAASRHSACGGAFRTQRGACAPVL